MLVTYRVVCTKLHKSYKITETDKKKKNPSNTNIHLLTHFRPF